VLEANILSVDVGIPAPSKDAVGLASLMGGLRGPELPGGMKSNVKQATVLLHSLVELLPTCSRWGLLSIECAVILWAGLLVGHQLSEEELALLQLIVLPLLLLLLPLHRVHLVLQPQYRQLQQLVLPLGVLSLAGEELAFLLALLQLHPQSLVICFQSHVLRIHLDLLLPYALDRLLQRQELAVLGPLVVVPLTQLVDGGFQLALLLLHVHIVALEVFVLLFGEDPVQLHVEVLDGLVELTFHLEVLLEAFVLIVAWEVGEASWVGVASGLVEGVGAMEVGGRAVGVGGIHAVAHG
jgi:hypothetical protein